MIILESNPTSENYTLVVTTGHMRTTRQMQQGELQPHSQLLEMLSLLLLLNQHLVIVVDLAVHLVDLLLQHSDLGAHSARKRGGLRLALDLLELSMHFLGQSARLLMGIVEGFPLVGSEGLKNLVELVVVGIRAAYAAFLHII